MALVSNIKKLCSQRNISIPLLEETMGFGSGAIYKWDTNKPGIDKVQKVADYFGVSVDSLIREELTNVQ